MKPLIVLNQEIIIYFISVFCGVFLFLLALWIDRAYKKKKYKSAIITELRSLIEFINILGLKKRNNEPITKERIDIKIEKTRNFFIKFYNEPILLKKFISTALELSGSNLKNIHILLSETECKLRENTTYSKFGLFGLCYLIYFTSDNKNEKKEFKHILEEFLNADYNLFGNFLKKIE